MGSDLPVTFKCSKTSFRGPERIARASAGPYLALSAASVAASACDMRSFKSTTNLKPLYRQIYSMIHSLRLSQEDVNRLSGSILTAPVTPSDFAAARAESKITFVARRS